MGIPKAEDMRYHLPTGEQILIPFTRDEWNAILNCVLMAYNPESFDDYEELSNIIDRIEKNLGIE